MSGRTIVDCRKKRYELLESETARSSLPQCSGSAVLPSSHDQKDRTGHSGTDESPDLRGYRRRHRQEGTAGAGAGRDVLHVVEARLFGRPGWRTLASASDVFHSRNRVQSLGRGSAGVANYHVSEPGGAPYHFYDSSWPLVGRYRSSSCRCALACDLERVFSVWSAAALLPLFWRLTLSSGLQTP